jgi:nucleotide-binding universal stress UspA family protein
MSGPIVVGVDGSPQSAHALEWAAARARLGHEPLELISAYSYLPDLEFYGYRGLSDTEPVGWYAEFSRQVLDAAATRVREVDPDLSCSLVSERAHPGTLLTEASERASMVVVGRRGLGDAASALLGSVSNRLTIQSTCPVVVVGGDQPASGPIVVGVDESEAGAAALRFALAEAAVRDTWVRAVAAYDVPMRPSRYGDELAERIRADNQAEVAGSVARAHKAARTELGSSVTVEEVVVEGRPAETILSHAGDAQLIVVGRQGKGLVRRVLLGSVSRQVLNDADRPVAVVGHAD